MILKDYSSRSKIFLNWWTKHHMAKQQAASPFISVWHIIEMDMTNRPDLLPG